MFLIKAGERKIADVAPQGADDLAGDRGPLSTDAIRLALEHHVDIALLDKHGEPYGRFWHNRLGSTNLLRRRLLEIAETEDGVALAAEWVQTKIGHQAGLLRELARTRPDRAANRWKPPPNGSTRWPISSPALRGAAIDELRGSLDGPGRGRRPGVLRRAQPCPARTVPVPGPQPFARQGRVQLPAQLCLRRPLLPGRTRPACSPGLDPCIGLMHTDNYNKPSLVYDLIELFRVHAERVVVNLFAARKVKQELFDQVEGGFRLNAEGRALLLGALNDHLDRMKQHGRRRLKIRDTIVYECQRLAGRLLRGLDAEVEVDLSVFDLAAQLEIPEASSAGERTPCADEAAPSEPDRATHRAQLEDGDAKDPGIRRRDREPARDRAGGRHADLGPVRHRQGPSARTRPPRRASSPGCTGCRRACSWARSPTTSATSWSSVWRR